MSSTNHPGFFDITERTDKLTRMGDPLVGLNERIDREAFRRELNRVHEKPRKSNAGAKPIDVVLMFKLLVLQQLHNFPRATGRARVCGARRSNDRRHVCRSG